MTPKRPKTADAHLLTPVEFHLEPRSNMVGGAKRTFWLSLTAVCEWSASRSTRLHVIK